MYQPLETPYNGYRFRSRLEARWAVFFDTLGIEYRYEPEGYRLDGVKYLPDFLLPEQDYFVEIKGQEPNKEEIRKAALLTAALNKPVFIFVGNIGIPDIATTIPKDRYGEYIPSYRKNAYMYDASELIIFGNDTASPCFEMGMRCEHGETCPHHLQFSSDHLARALYRAELISPYGDYYRLQVTKENELVCLAPTYKDDGQRQFAGRTPIPLPTPIKELEQEFIALLSCESEMWEWGIAGLSHLRGYVWCECLLCHKLGITVEGRISHLPCYKRDDHYWFEPEDNERGHNTPRLIEAYTTARQERFGT